MKRYTVVGRVTLLAEKQEKLREAADLPTDTAWHRFTRALALQRAALEYADVVRRYIGGHGG